MHPAPSWSTADPTRLLRTDAPLASASSCLSPGGFDALPDLRHGSGHHAASDRPAQAQRIDPEIIDIARFVVDGPAPSPAALQAAHWSLLDSLGCALGALHHGACRRLLGPSVPGLQVTGGARVPGTRLELDPIDAAFNLGAMIRWLDFNDTWLAAEWGHPSDNLGGILAVGDWMARRAERQGQPAPTMARVLDALVRAYEIQGCLALENAFNRRGIDHVILVKVASAAVCTHLLGGDLDAVTSAVSHAWVDGHPLRIYRQAPNVGARKSWAAGDATARGVRLALLAMRGEPPVASALSAPRYGFCATLMGGEPLRFQRPYGDHVVQHVLYKAAWPAEFHAQTAVEAAIGLHHSLHRHGIDPMSVPQIRIRTHEAALRIIDKTGPLANPADRDHCLRYMVAVALLFGRLTADDYEDSVAADPRIDALRRRMTCIEDPGYTRDYHDPQRRSVANAVAVTLADGQMLDEVVVEYPLGHPRRRAEGLIALRSKLAQHLKAGLPTEAAQTVLQLADTPEQLANMPIHRFIECFSHPEEENKTWARP